MVDTGVNEGSGVDEGRALLAVEFVASVFRRLGGVDSSSCPPFFNGSCDTTAFCTRGCIHALQSNPCGVVEELGAYGAALSARPFWFNGVMDAFDFLAVRLAPKMSPSDVVPVSQERFSVD